MSNGGRPAQRTRYRQTIRNAMVQKRSVPRAMCWSWAAARPRHRGPAAGLVGPARARGGPPAGGDEPELPESLTPSCGKFFDLMGDPPGDRRRGVRPQPRPHGVVGVVRAAGGAVRRRACTAGRSPSGRLSRVMLERRGRRRVPGRAPGGRPPTRCWRGRRRFASMAPAAPACSPDLTASAATSRDTAPWRWSDDGARRADGPSTIRPTRCSSPMPTAGPGRCRSTSSDRAIAVMVDPRTTALSRGDGAGGRLSARSSARRPTSPRWSTSGRARRRSVGMGRVDVLRRTAGRRHLAAGRGRRVVHRPVVVGRCQEGDGVGVAGGGDGQHRPGRPAPRRRWPSRSTRPAKPRPMPSSWP